MAKGTPKDERDLIIVKAGELCNCCYYEIKPDGSCSPSCFWAQDSQPGPQPATFYRRRLHFRRRFRLTGETIVLRRI